ncbi:MAG TPA: CaiB/BaiF CoA-transferase family protein [Chloroflexota bacterium]|nr:CaiB/BaiF CoA-transferase family protein [Chloroflexota bacterium]
MRPLEGYRVLDFSRALAGPYCTALLADLGADVIKVEEPGAGDEARHWGPPFFGGESAYFLSMNRSKRSIAVNLKAPEGLALCLRLAAGADVVVENFRPGVAGRIGIGFDAVRGRQAGVVYCSISAYGQDGPLAQEPGYDLIMQGVGGLMSVTGEKDGRPLKAGVAETDILAGTNAALAINGALLARERAKASGAKVEARYLDVGLLDGQVSLMGYHLVSHLLSGRVPGPSGNALPYIVPYQGFRTATFEITVAVNNDRLWRAFCAAIERPDLLRDDRFSTNGDRVRNREALLAILEALFETQAGDEWLGRLQKHGVPAGPINAMDRVAAHPQVQARGLLARVNHPMGEIPVPVMPWREGVPDGRAPQELPGAPPLLGQHTEQVLVEELGYSKERIAELEAGGVVQCLRP